MKWQIKIKEWDLRYKHSMCGTLIYSKYSHAKERCTPYYKNHKRYYDRGIRFLWNSFEEFYNDMNDSFEEHIKKYWAKETTLDRIDNDWNYCKENCRWATRQEQSRNRNMCKKFIYNWKEYKTLKEFCNETWHNPHTISIRMNRDWMNLIEAIETPLTPNDGSRNKWKEIIYKWKKYKGVLDLCRKMWLNKNTIYVRMYRWATIDEAIEKPIDIKYKRNKNNLNNNKKQKWKFY